MSALRVGKMARSLGTNALAARCSSSSRRDGRRSSSVAVVAGQRNNTQRTATIGAAAVLSAGTTMTAAAPAARAEDSITVDSAVDAVVEIVRAAGGAVKQGLGIAQQGLEVAGDAYKQVAPAVQTATDAVAPAVKATVKAATPTVEAGVRAASGAANNVVPSLERAITSAGFDPKTLSTAAETAVTTTKPILESLFTFLTTSSPTVLAETALGLVAAYYLLPPVLKAAGGALRGYAGDVSPPAALDALSQRGNAVMVDIRTAREKESQGIPDLPNSSRLIELEFASIDDRRVRGQLRDIGGLETKITAMQVAALKRLGKGTTVYLLDKNGGAAKAVARELAARGFKRVFVISGGFSNWAKDRLGVKLSTTVSRVEVLLPGSQSFRSGGATSGSRQLPAAPVRRALPSGTSAGGR